VTPYPQIAAEIAGVVSAHLKQVVGSLLPRKSLMKSR